MITTQQQRRCICICIWRNIPAGKLIQHNNNECVNNNQCVLYLYLREYSGRKVKVTNKCILYLYLTEYSGRKVDTTQQQWMCIVFVLDGIFRPESKSEQYMYIVFVIGRNIPAGKLIQHNNNKCVLYLYWTEYSGRKVNRTHKQQSMCIVFVLDGIFLPESWYYTTTINVYCICIGRNIPAGK